jgi:hypothetical protein
MANFLKNWSGIPDGSHLELSLAIDSDDPPVVVDAQIVDAASNELVERWEFADVSPGPAEFPIRAGQRFSLSMTITFMGPQTTTGTLTARVLQKSGSPWGKVFSQPVQGSGSQTTTLTSFLNAEG